jgi:AAA domain-containing protein
MPSDPGAASHPPSPRSGRRLDSWKEIADYLRRGITTVQRWEREEGLPVQRHIHNTGGSVFAHTADIDDWLVGRVPLPATSHAAEPHSPIDSSDDDTRSLEAPGGAVPLDSPYYIRRPADDVFQDAIVKRAAIVLVKGPRQVGKSSLLARALEHARRTGAVVAFTDVQALGSDDLRSPAAFYQALARSIAEQLGFKSSILTEWNEHDSPNTNFSRYVQRSVLEACQGGIIWGLDEIDRLLGRDYAADVFGLFRSWHSRRALDPAAPWRHLTLALAYATEAHLLIADANQSPFNVGVRVALEDFTIDEVMALNVRYGSPLATSGAVGRLMALVGGHPYLLQWAFSELRRDIPLETIEAEAISETGPFGDHLRRLRAALERDPALEHAMNAVVRDGACPGRDSFYRLRSAGLIQGTSPSDPRPRCGLYNSLVSDP